MTGTVRSGLLVAYRRILRPLVRILIRHGISFGELAEGAQLGELGLIAGIGHAAGSQAVALMAMMQFNWAKTFLIQLLQKFSVSSGSSRLARPDSCKRLQRDFAGDGVLQAFAGLDGAAERYIGDGSEGGPRERGDGISSHPNPPRRIRIRW